MASLQPRSKMLAWMLTCSFIIVFSVGCSESLGATRQFEFQNHSLRASWQSGDPTLRLTNLATGQTLAVPIALSGLEFGSASLARADVTGARVSVTQTSTGEVWRFTWPDQVLPNSSSVRCQTSFELDRDLPWVRKQATVQVRRWGRRELLKEVVIDNLDVKGLAPRQPFDGWQSYPVLCDGFFAGVEFPAAQARVTGDTARLSCRPGIWLAGGETYEVKPAVYGVAPPGRSRQAFEDYIQSFRPKSPPIHVQYNSWWSAPYPFTEQQMLDIIRAFHDHYHKPRGGRLDSYCLDMGWANSQSVWQIDANGFPQGFEPLTCELGRMNASLALWVSPSSFYQMPGGLDTEWARQQGYETFSIGTDKKSRRVCLAGPRFAAAYRDALVGHVRNYHIAHYKFDGYAPTCPESDHGHEPGDLSAEKMAEGFIMTCQALRQANPDIWLEATCFGFRPSPWWLAHVNTVIGTFGCDAPTGRVPCPVHRESYTTARDFYNLQGTRDVLIPIYSQEVLGIIHQTTEPLQNDALVSVLRGHSFIPMYVNPKYMDARRWRFLAELTTWARDNASLLAHTRALPLGGWSDDRTSRDWAKPLPRDPYGYAHFHQGRGLLLLRNPWIKPQSLTLKLDESVGADRTLQDAEMVCLYPTFGKQGGPHSYGSDIVVDLRPYETRLLAFGGYEDAPTLPPDTRRVEANNVGSQVDAAAGKARMTFEARGDCPGRQLWLLCEGPSVFQEPACTISVNGNPVETRQATSVGQWAAGHPSPEQWTWIMADLPAGNCTVQADVLAQDDVRFSAWLVLKEALEDDPSSSGPVPPPEERVLDALELLAPVDLRGPEPSTQPNIALAASGTKATASSVWSPAYTPDKAIDGNAETRWNSASGDVAGAWLAVEFPSPRTISMVSFSEAAGGRITSYKLQAWDGSNWNDLLTAMKPAARTRVHCRFDPVTTTHIRLRVIAATTVPTSYEIEAR